MRRGSEDETPKEKAIKYVNDHAEAFSAFPYSEMPEDDDQAQERSENEARGNMIDVEAMKRIDELNALYKKGWGKDVDYFAMPCNCSQKDLVVVLERIVNTGESVLVGWSYTKKRTHS